MTVNLLCHLERLPDYGTGDHVYFSLNVTAALDADPGSTVDRKLVAPWLWTIGAIDVWLEKNSEVTESRNATRVGEVADRDSPFAKKLDAILDGFIEKKDEKTFVWNAADEELARDGDKLRWHDFLIHASTYPPALTQKGGISFIFHVTNLGDADRIVAAPRIDFGDGERVPLAPKRDLKDGTNDLHYVQVGTTGAHVEPFFYEWKYDQDVVAYQRECLLEPDVAKTNDQFLDRASGWVTVPGAETTAEEWALQLESRISEAFDLPLRMIEALRGTAITDANRERVIDMVTAAMHDIAATGVHRAKSGTTIVHDLVALVLQDLGSGRAAEIRARLTVYEEGLTLATWRESLKGATKTELFDKDRVADANVVDELLRIHGLLTDETTLRALLVRQWEAALEGEPELLDELARAKGRLLADVLPRYSLRKLFLLDALQEVWADLSALGKSATREQQVATIVRNATAALQTYLHERFSASPSRYRRFEPRGFAASADVEQTVARHVETYLEQFVQKIVPAERAVDEGQDALLIQLADVVRSDADPTSEADQADSSRRISGYGVLLRRAGDASPWRCLNLARVVAGDGTPLADDVPVPVRLGFRNGVRQSFVAYENVPLVAESPFIAPLAETHPLEDSVSRRATDPPFEYRNPYGAGAGQPKLVPLVYGDDYEAAAFAIGTAGSLPRGLAKATRDDGGNVVSVEPTVIDLANASPEAVRTLKFRRRTPVGQPRLFEPKTKSAFATLALPEVPRTVLPLTRSLDAAEQRNRTGREDDEESRPLLLLRPNEPSFSAFGFALRPPSVDIHTWDRWVAKDRADATVRQARIDVWRGYHAAASDAGTKLRATGGRVDLSLDDPAVSGWIVRLTRRYPDAAATLDAGPVDLEPSTGNELLDVGRHKHLEVNIRVETGIDTAPRPSLTSTRCDIVVPAGQVWSLEIFPVGELDEVKARFAKDVALHDTSGSKVLFEPFALDIEATPESIEIPAGELFDALGLPETGAENDLAITIDGTALEKARPWVHRIELVVQQWRWSGRPIVRPVKDENGNFAGLADGFVPRVDPNVDAPIPPNEDDDAVLFADRSPVDALIVPGFVDFVAEPPPGAHPIELHRRDLASTKGALYFRVALRAFSRYAGLAGLDVSGDSRRAKESEAWRRRLVPCRWSDPVPSPVVKMIVPLTRPLGDQKTPPLLAVLDEPWGDTGGLAEKFVADIVSVDVTDHPRVTAALPNETSLPELGPDPLLSVTRNEARPKARAAIGPIGYTFDTDTDAPLFVKSSFILPPPDGVDDLSWYFVKLQFRRELEPEWTATRTYSTSAPAPPVWAQYLPPSTRFGDIQVGALELRIDAERGFFVRDGRRVTLEPGKPDAGATCTFELHVILTDRIEDASGRPDQEVFLEVSQLGPDGTFAVTRPGADRRARIVEIQRRGGTTRSVWEDLFVSDPRTDAKARIVRVSPPIRGA